MKIRQIIELPITKTTLQGTTQEDLERDSIRDNPDGKDPSVVVFGGAFVEF